MPDVIYVIYVMHDIYDILLSLIISIPLHYEFGIILSLHYKLGIRIRKEPKRNEIDKPIFMKFNQ